MKRLLLLALGCYCCSILVAMADTGEKGGEESSRRAPAFRKAIGGSSFESSRQVLQLPEGGYLMVGRTASHGEGDTDMNVIKLSESGEVIWNKRYGEEDSEEASDVLLTADGGYMIFGSADDYDDSKLRNVWIIKLNKEGDILWDRNYGIEGAINSAHAAVATPDGGYIVVGNSISISSESTCNMYALKIDMEGNEIWEKTYGGDSNEEAKDIAATPEGFAIIGNTESYGKGRWDMFLVRIDHEGNKIAHHTYGGNDNEMGNAIISTKDGGFLLGGYSYSYSKGSLDAWVVKTDANGEQQWHKSFGQESTDEAFSLLELADGSFMMAGYVDIYEPNDEYINISKTANEALVVKLSVSGEVVWEKLIGGDKNQKAFSIIESNDGGFVVVGSTDEGSSTDALVFKLNSMGE